MREFVKPIIVVSKCLGFANCRYNGAIINDDFVEKLRNFVEFKTVCAEVEIGLGIPREPVRVVNTNGNLKLIQPTTGLDFTDTMKDFANSFLDSISEADGFILKSRSPSCGIKDVKIYPSADSNMVIEKGSGFFGGAILEKFSYLAVEDEGRLTNFRIREHFLTSIYTFACFRKVKSSDSLSHEEKAFFLDALEKYRKRKVPLSVPLNILRSFIVRFNEDYLMKQTFFEPSKEP